MALLIPLWQQNEQFTAQADRHLITITGTTGVVDSGSFVVSQRGAGANMSVDISPGSVIITGTQSSNQGRYLAQSTGTENRAVATAPGSGSRIDLVVARVLDSAVSGATDAFEIVVVTGTPSGSPSAPVAPENSVVLAEVLVGTNVSSITDAAITDVRARSKPFLLNDGLTMDNGPIIMDGQSIQMANGGRATDPQSPTHASHLARKGYVDTQRDSRVAKSGDTMSGTLNMDSNQIGGLPAPTAAGHAVRKSYADALIGDAIQRQSLTSFTNVSLGSGTRNMNVGLMTIPSGWNSAIIMVNGAFEWRMRGYDNVRYTIRMQDANSGTDYCTHTSSISKPSASTSGVWHHQVVPFVGSNIVSNSFVLRYQSEMSRLDGTAPGSSNVYSTRRRFHVLKIRIS